MLTRLRIRNFKIFDKADIELGKAVVLIGPNNCGKTTALQALALWEIGLRKWNEKRKGKASPEKRPGVTINRRDLISIPIPNAGLLWRDLHVRNAERAGGKTRTQNVCVEIIVDGVSDGEPWSCGLEFDYANEESFYCRPLTVERGEQAKRMPVPEHAATVHVAFLPPMSGLAAREPKWEPGMINVLIGEGQTAQVLRNLCYQIRFGIDHQDDWQSLVGHIRRLFGVELTPPEHISERGEITMAYSERRGIQLDLSSSGRGLQQTLLLLVHLYANPGTVLLLDEPDAHLEILRQREIYGLLMEIAEAQGSQVIAASHSEVVLNEAADQDVVIAFVGSPHRIDNHGSQVLKALRDIGFDQYYQAEQTGWVLYLEDSTDLAILRAFAKTLGHEAQQPLERPFFHPVATNLPQKARDHFFGLQEAKRDLVGIAIFDRLDKDLQRGTQLIEVMWRRREIENYLCTEEVLLRFAREIFGHKEAQRREQTMKESIGEVSEALRTFDKPDPWSPDLKVTDDLLIPVFRKYYAKLNLPLQLRKADYHVLAGLMPKDKIDPEIVEKLDMIAATARSARPRL